MEGSSKDVIYVIYSRKGTTPNILSVGDKEKVSDFVKENE